MPRAAYSDRSSEQCAQPGARPCPKGKFDSGLAKGCVECPPGHFKHSDGAGMCKPCPVNTYAAGPGSTACDVRFSDTLALTLLSLSGKAYGDVGGKDVIFARPLPGFLHQAAGPQHRHCP